MLGIPTQDGESGKASWRRSHLSADLIVSRHQSTKFGNGQQDGEQFTLKRR